MAETSRRPNELEQRLVEAVVRGELPDLTADEAVDEAAMASWGTGRGIRAWVLRDIVRGRLAADPDPRGLRRRGARIAGRLDLENVSSDLAVALSDCFLPDGLVLRNARLWVLGLPGCRIGQPAGSTAAPMDATWFTARVMMLGRSVVTADSPDGAVGLYGAQIGQQPPPATTCDHRRPGRDRERPHAGRRSRQRGRRRGRHLPS